MSTLAATRHSHIGLGILAFVLGAIGLMLSLLPILGIPISAFGLLCGIFGILLGFFAGMSSLRWSLMGSAACCLALGVNLVIVYAPGGYLAPSGVPPPWQPVPDRPYVSPPAMPVRLAPD